MKMQKSMSLEDKPPRLVGVQYATGEEWRNTSRKKMPGGKSKPQCCKEQYYIGTWNIRSMNQDKLDMVRQEMARKNIDIRGSSELKWTGMGEFK